MIAEAGLPVGEHAHLSQAVTGLVDRRPWKADRIYYEEAPGLAGAVSEAEARLHHAVSDALAGIPARIPGS